MKRFVSIILSAALTAAVSAPVAAENSDGYATRGEVRDMLYAAADDYNPDVRKSDILQGYEDGALHEDWYVTRAEALVMLRRAFGKIPEPKGANKLLMVPAEEFTDLPDWAVSEFSDVFAAGIAAGTDEGIFSPDENVTKEQMRIFINRTYRVFGTNERDDFYGATNKELIDNVELPDGYTEYGTLLEDNSTYDVSRLITDIASKKQIKGSKEEKLANLYNNYMDIKSRDADGLGELEGYIDAVNSVKTVADFSKISYEDELLAGVFVGFLVSVDLKDSNKYTTYFSVPEVYDKQYFNDPLFETNFKNYYARLAILCGETEEQAKKDAEYCYIFEKAMAAEQITAADQRDIGKLYNVYTLDKLDDIYDTVDLDALYKETGLRNRDKIIVTNDSGMRLLAKMLTDENIDMMKAVAKLELIDSYAIYLSSDFVKASDEFEAELYGYTGETDMEYAAIDTAISFMPDYVGELYAQKYNDESVNADVRDIVDEIEGVYREKIKSAKWMTDKTKQKALSKLDTMHIKIGAPDKWNDYMDDAEILSYAEGGSLINNIINISDAAVEYMYSLEGTEVDRTQWMMYPYEANACYYAQNNDIIVTAAMLDTMVYDKDATYEYNLGAIGTIIAHEMTHAFDASGAQFDENGNLNNWWTAEDAAAFADLCDDVLLYYEGLEGAPGIAVPSDITLTENMADLGAMEIVTAVADKHEGFDYKQMYEGYSYIWYTTMTRQMAQYLSINDTHSFPSIRVNRVLQSIDRFYEVYGITENDGMYIPPEQRVHFWS